MKINLKVWMAIKAIPALLLLIYLMTIGYALNWQMFTSLALFLLVLMKLLLKYYVEDIDERAKEIINRTDALCYKLSICIMGILVLPFLFVEPVQSIQIGYLIISSISTLTIIRIIIFIILDKRGD